MDDELVALPGGGVLRRSRAGDCEVEIVQVVRMRVSELVDLVRREGDSDGAAIFVRTGPEGLSTDPLEPRLWGAAGLLNRVGVLVIDRDLRVSVSVTLPAVRDTQTAMRRSRSVCAGSSLSVFDASFYEDQGVKECEITLQCTPEVTLGEVSRVCNMLRNDLIRTDFIVDGPSDVFRMLKSGHWSSLVGMCESEWLEVKAEFHGLGQRTRRHEFALDVSSLANSPLGGVLVVGFTTQKDRHGRDVINDVAGGFRKDVSIPQIEDILHEYVFPRPEGMEISVFEHDEGTVLALLIPPQSETRRPFLVKGSQIDSGSLSGLGFTWVTRRGASKRALTIAEIHARLSEA